MAYRLGGRNSLPYLGVEAPTPANTVLNKRSPTSTDSQNFNIGTFWLKTDAHNEAEEVWILISLSGGVATWVQLYPTGAGGASEFIEDVGIANDLAGVINVFGGAGSGGFININTKGSGNTIEIILNDFIQWPNSVAGLTEGSIWLGGIPFMHNLGTLSTFLGEAAGPTANSSTGNTGIGSFALSGITTGENNSALGRSAGISLTSGNTNLLLGDLAGSDYTTENNNICLSNLGTIADSGAIRIGTLGTHGSAYIQGIYNADIGATNAPVFIDNTGKLGTMESGISLVGSSFLAYVNPSEVLAGAGVQTTSFVGATQAMNIAYDNFGTFNVGPVAGGAFFTVPLDGYYSFNASIGMSGLASNSGSSLVGILFKNGTPIALSSGRTYSVGAVQTIDKSGTQLVSITILLNASDIITFGFVYSSAGGSTPTFNGITGAGIFAGAYQVWISGTLVKTAP